MLFQEGLRAERHVSHLHYTAWPDHGIPESTTSIMTFRELVRERIQSAKDAGPTLVHCRQGAALRGQQGGTRDLLVHGVGGKTAPRACTGCRKSLCLGTGDGRAAGSLSSSLVWRGTLYQGV